MATKNKEQPENAPKTYKDLHRYDDFYKDAKLKKPNAKITYD